MNTILTISNIIFYFNLDNPLQKLLEENELKIIHHVFRQIFVFGQNHKNLNTPNLTIIESLVIMENAANKLHEVSGKYGAIIEN